MFNQIIFFPLFWYNLQYYLMNQHNLILTYAEDFAHPLLLYNKT